MASFALSILPRQDVTSTLESVSGVNSWSTCMSKTWCKWPVIIGIVLASITVISIVWCLARCLCCGLSCCCDCFRCLSCCTPSRSNRRSKQSKHADGPGYAPMPYQGYQPTPGPMAYQNAGPQFATFDAPTKNIHEDSLPAMPSWDNAPSRRVEDHSELDHGEDMEMGRLDHSSLASGALPAAARTSRNGYSQIHGQEADVYGSDLGAQRLGDQPQQQPEAYGGYSDYHHQQPVPFSPAPTYATNPPAISGNVVRTPAHNNSDRFAPGALSPTPSQYNHPNSTHSSSYFTPQSQQTPFFTQQQQSYAAAQSPYTPSASTRYEPTDYPSSQYQQHQPLPSYQYGARATATSPSPPPAAEQRPPSLLMVGRKPVNGSAREI